ncbi:hypothetical protein [Spirosoma gilvum]
MYTPEGLLITKEYLPNERGTDPTSCVSFFASVLYAFIDRSLCPD